MGALRWITLEQMDWSWFHVFCCLRFASNVIFKDSIINFRGAWARKFQQLNMGFGKGSSSQIRQGGLRWLRSHRETDQRGRHGEEDQERSRGQRRDVPPLHPQLFPQILTVNPGFQFSIWDTRRWLPIRADVLCSAVRVVCYVLGS